MSVGGTDATGGGGAGCAGGNGVGRDGVGGGIDRDGVGGIGGHNDSGIAGQAGVDHSAMAQVEASFDELEKTVKQAKEVLEQVIDGFAENLGAATAAAVSAITGNMALAKQIGELVEKAVKTAANGLFDAPLGLVRDMAAADIARMAVAIATDVVDTAIDSLPISEPVRTLAKAALNAVMGNIAGTAVLAGDALGSIGVIDAAYLEKSFQEIEQNVTQRVRDTVTSFTNSEFADVAVAAIKDKLAGDSTAAADRLKGFAQETAKNAAGDYLPEQIRDLLERAF